MLTLLLALTLSGGFTPSSGYSTVQDEGTNVTRRSTVNFTGAGVSCADTGGKTVCTISGGGVGSANVVDVTVVFVSTGGYASTVVTGQAWVLTTSSIVCSPKYDSAVSGTNNTPEVYALAQFSLTVSALSAGTGFTLNVFSPNGISGSFVFSCTGA